MASERVQAYEDKMVKAVEFLKNDLQTIRAGRANPHVLDKIRVDYYGTPTPIQQLANISVPEARMIQIAPWDKKSLKDIERAIMASDVGINPKELAKDVQKRSEGVKVTIRNARRDGNDEFKKLRKDSQISEDDEKDFQTELQKLTDKYIAKVDQVAEEKKKEIMTV